MTTAAQTTALNYFTSQGYTPSGASAITSALQVESGLNPTSQNNSGSDNGGAINPSGAFGIAQWNGSRQAALLNYANSTGGDVNSLQTQLGFVNSELKSSYSSTYNALTTGTDGASQLQSVVQNYEVPANIQAEVSKASGYLSQFTSALTGQGLANVAGSSATQAAGGAAVVAQSVPLAIDAQTMGATADTAAQNAAIKAAAASTNNTNQADTTATLKTYTGFFGSLESFLASMFVQGGFVFLGLVFLAVGLFMLYRSNINNIRIEKAA